MPVGTRASQLMQPIKEPRQVGAKGSGRPSSYSPEIADHILERIECHGDSLKRACKSLAEYELPTTSPQSVRRWSNQNVAGFSDRFARACELRTHVWGEQILEIADNESTESGQINRDRLRVDTRKWLMSVLNPQYSDKRQVEHTGRDGGPIEMVDPTELARGLLAVMSALEHDSNPSD